MFTQFFTSSGMHNITSFTFKHFTSLPLHVSKNMLDCNRFTSVCSELNGLILLNGSCETNMKLKTTEMYANCAFPDNSFLAH